jgi:hypothetical protein
VNRAAILAKGAGRASRIAAARPRTRSHAPAARALAIAATLLALALAPAPRIEAASFFSVNGLGETISTATGRGRALGGVSVALADPLRVSLDNPALLGSLERVSFSAVYVAERRNAESGAASETFTDGNFPFVTAAIPFKSFVVVGFGLVREQNVFVNPIILENVEDPASYSLRFSRSGDLFRVPIALSRRVTPWLQLGWSADFWFGSLDEERIIDFASASFRDTNDRTRDEVDGTSWSAGFVARPLPRVSAGLRYRASKSLDGTRTNETEDGGTTNSIVAHSVPASIAGGVHAAILPRVAATIEVRRDLWEGEEGDSPPGQGFVDATRLGGGLELTPPADRAETPALLRAPWRVGFQRSEWHFRDFRGEKITEWLLSAGTSMTLGSESGVVDFVFELGRRGSIDDNALEEKLYRFALGFSGGEPWKKPTKGRRGGVPATTPTY